MVYRWAFHICKVVHMYICPLHPHERFHPVHKSTSGRSYTICICPDMLRHQDTCVWFFSSVIAFINSTRRIVGMVLTYIPQYVSKVCVSSLDVETGWSKESTNQCVSRTRTMTYLFLILGEEKNEEAGTQRENRILIIVINHESWDRSRDLFSSLRVSIPANSHIVRVHNLVSVHKTRLVSADWAINWCSFAY